jgi:hypothetical protein
MKKYLLVMMLATVALTPASAQKRPGKGVQPASILTQWLDLHCRLVRQAKGIQHVAYSRHFSYTALAAHESLMASDRPHNSMGGQLNGLGTLPVVRVKGYVGPAGLNAAYAEMLRHFYSPFGTSSASIDSLENLVKKQLSVKETSSLLVEKSSAYGKDVARFILNWAKTDGSDLEKKYIANQGEGLWIPSGPSFVVAAPFWSENRSLTRDLSKAYHLRKPAYASDSLSDFYKMAREVYDVTTHLTPEQKEIALFWDDAPNGKYLTAFGHWTSILSGLIKQEKISLAKASEAYLKMALSMHEACLLAWKGKYEYNVIRPVSFIRQYIDKNWSPLIGTPPHPEFPAAHATLSNAAATALTSVFGNSCPVTDRSYLDIGMKERHYSSLQEVAREAGMSRLYGGIHYRHSIEEGFLLGEASAKHVLQNLRLQKTEGRELHAKRR